MAFPPEMEQAQPRNREDGEQIEYRPDLPNDPAPIGDRSSEGDPVNSNSYVRNIDDDSSSFGTDTSISSPNSGSFPGYDGGASPSRGHRRRSCFKIR